MARLFDDASVEHLSVASTPVTAAPVTLACWAYTNDVTVRQDALSINQRNGAGNAFVIGIDGAAAGDKVFAKAYQADSNSQSVTGTGVSVNVWHHLCGVFTSATSRTAYIDGAAGGENTTSRTPAGLNTITIGDLEYWESTMDAPFSGGIAETAIWNVALTAAEIASLAKGLSPLGIRPIT